MFESMIASVEGMVERKVNSMGRSLINQIISATPIGAALDVMEEIEKFSETGGENVLEKLGEQLLEKLKPEPIPYVGRFLHKRRAGRYEWQRVPWAGSRQDWLANRWRHDWRSQPRYPVGSGGTHISHRKTGNFVWHVGGEWTAGRLDQPVLGARAVGKGKPRTSRKSRKMHRTRNRYRKIGIEAAKGIMSSWSEH